MLVKPYPDDDKLLRVRTLYDRYAGLLLGYISEVIKDRDEAERILISVFSELHLHLNDMNNAPVGPFSYLQLMTRRKLATLRQRPGNSAIGPVIAPKSNRYLDLLGEDQYKVFCGLHYEGKSTQTLAQELDKTPEAIRILLKEAFTIIRRGHQA